ncbi:ABC transporter permease [Weissella paramesenteroides]|uniref:ABC transporter permease n=1 Tax=Weissella paramesenteroides TaxID=1249 RepID=A0ABD4XJR5_WEIPA|nr:ABC transporter permease [Weissella paramesenteroides]KAA8439873.1 ABC transporter permease [Weissella paramesenteroides]KAA8441370.1 ABC transporter permease [Weissella paramesenteroides]KAA8444112.1 ABC transporter permease [Weissella paramesenteroides]KAA8448683.1 ABC transporter permease [Weissella paramesenteroides]KAA8450792.1 ABC transporter permease [Weissella paramesenteroides]
MFILCYRNLLLYFRNKSGVFFSLLAAIISFILYIAFLKDTIAGNWGRIPGHNAFLDLWLIGGTLGITAITTTLSALSQKVEDHEKDTENDFILTGTSRFKLTFGYVLSAAVISYIMQIVVFVVMYVYFHFVDDLSIALSKIVMLIGLMVLGSVVNALVSTVIMIFVHNRNTLNAIASLVGTVSGFLVGAYIPIGILPEFAQFLVKLTPGSYVASLYRQTLLNDDMVDLFPKVAQRNEFSEELGIQLKWDHLLNFNQSLMTTIGLFVLFLIIVLVVEYRISNKMNKLDY